MQSKQRMFVVSVVVAAVVLIGAGGRASAADEWFVLGEQTIKAVDQGVEIKSQGGRFEKDVKQMKLSVDGADVELKKVVLQWDNRKDDTLTNESGRVDDAERCSGTQGPAQVGDGHVQDRGGCPDGRAQGLGV